MGNYLGLSSQHIQVPFTVFWVSKGSSGSVNIQAGTLKAIVSDKAGSCENVKFI